MTPTTPSIEFKDTGVFNPTPGPTLEVGEVMTQEKLTKIESIIRECNPELQELSFGCQGKDSDGLWTLTYEGWQLKNGYSAFPPEQIIGHPIHLEHILRAMQSHGITLLFMERKNIIKCTHVGEYITNAELDFTLHLHLQSDEFISWLYVVLVGE